MENIRLSFYKRFEDYCCQSIGYKEAFTL